MIATGKVGMGDLPAALQCVMGILGQCYACGIRVKHGDLAFGAGLELVCTPPWRARYAARSNGGHVDGKAIVILCSDRCEVDYGRKVGYAPDCCEVSTSKQGA